MSHFSSNIPSSIFYGTIFSKNFRIASCTLIISDFLPRASGLFSRMRVKSGNRAALTKKLKKAFQRYPNAFQKFCKTREEIKISGVKNTLLRNIHKTEFNGYKDPFD